MMTSPFTLMKGDYCTGLTRSRIIRWLRVQDRKVYQKGIALSKKAMQAIESRLERHPELPKWDILIRPASAL
jgi:hypothetical protein